MHWIHASAFFVLLGTGLVLYVPRLSALIARRPLVKDLHVYTAIAWIVLLGIVVVLGDRRGLRRTLRDLDAVRRRRPSLASTQAQAAGTLQRRAEGARCAGRGLRVSLRGLRLPALARRAGHPLPLGEHDPPPRRADVRLARASPGPPLSGTDLPGDPSRAARNHRRLRAPRLGARAPPEVDRA